jgi:hypothetical protein
MLDIVVFRGMKHWQISQVFFAVYRSHDSQILIRSSATALGATVGSSSNRLAVSFMLAAKDRLQHSGDSGGPDICPQAG